MKGIELLEFIITYGKGEPRIMVERGHGRVCVHMMWLGWCREHYSETISEALTGLAVSLEEAIKEGLLREDT